MKTFYLVACVVGFAVPYAPFVAWLLDNGIDPAAFLREIADHASGSSPGSTSSSRRPS